MHGTTFVSYSQFAVAANLRGRGLSQSSRSCYSETAPFQDGKQSQMHSHGLSSAIATTETSPGLGGYATCRFLMLADGLGVELSTPRNCSAHARYMSHLYFCSFGHVIACTGFRGFFIVYATCSCELSRSVACTLRSLDN